MQILFIVIGWGLGTETPKGWLIGAMTASTLIIYAHFRSNRRKDEEEVFPGLHPYSLKYIYRRIGILRKWPLVLFVFVVVSLIFFPHIMVDIYWLSSADTSLDTVVKSPLTLYFIGVVGLITYILIREEAFREIRSLKSLERIIANQPNMTDVQYGFMLRATHSPVSSIIYTEVLDGYLALSYTYIETEYVRVREQLPKVLTNGPVSELTFGLQDLARDFNLQAFVYLEISKPLVLWIDKYLGKGAEESWSNLLGKENRRTTGIENMVKSLFKPQVN